MATGADLDGRYAQGWGGLAPNGVHVNVLLARRGTPTAAAITTAYTAPTADFTPVLVSLGKDQPSYETLYPPTVIMNKHVIANDTLLWGATPIGASQAVLDVVAEGLLEADLETVILISVWIDPNATDETIIKEAMRAAVGDALREAIQGRPAKDVEALVANRENVTHPFYGGK